MIWLIGCSDTDTVSGHHVRRDTGQNGAAHSTQPLTMNISLTKKPMKPITMKPNAVRTVILLNSASGSNNFSKACTERVLPKCLMLSQQAHLFDLALCTV